MTGQMRRVWDLLNGQAALHLGYALIANIGLAAILLGLVVQAGSATDSGVAWDILITTAMTTAVGGG